MDLASTTINLGGLVTLGSRDVDGTVWRIAPDGFTGWGEPGSTLSPVQKPRQSGAWAGDSFNTARAMTVSGTIRALTPALLNQAIDVLLTAVTNAPFLMTVTESGLSRWVMARKQGETLVPKVTNLIANYSIMVTALDSRKFGASMSGSTFLPATSGGMAYPFSIPFGFPAVAISGQLSLFNSGNETGPVVARIDGPAVGPVITHNGSGLALTFASSLVLNAGEWLTVDMERHTAMANDQASRSGYITQRGWSGFDPGNNTWSLTAASFNAATKLTITATPAYK